METVIRQTWVELAFHGPSIVICGTLASGDLDLGSQRDYLSDALSFQRAFLSDVNVLSHNGLSKAYLSQITFVYQQQFCCDLYNQSK